MTICQLKEIIVKETSAASLAECNFLNDHPDDFKMDLNTFYTLVNKEKLDFVNNQLKSSFEKCL